MSDVNIHDLDVSILRKILWLVSLKFRCYSLLLCNMDAAKMSNLVKDHDHHLVNCSLIFRKSTHCCVMVDSQFSVVFILRRAV